MSESDPVTHEELAVQPSVSRIRHVWAPHMLLAILAATVAVAALAGWCMDMPLLTTFAPGRPALTPMTAVGLLVASAANVALVRRARLALSLATLVVLEGLAVIAAHVMKMSTVMIAASIWSSRLTGVMFVGCGLGCALLAMQRFAAGQAISFGLLLVAALMALAHVFPSADLYAYMPGTGVAAPTVIAFLALSLSQLLACRQHGFAGALTSRNVAGKTGRWLLLAGGAVVLMLTVVATLASRLQWLDPESAVLLIGWGAMVVLGVTLWSLAVAVDGAETARAQAEKDRDQVRGMLVAALTHDLRNPLQAATLYTSLLMRFASDAQSVNALERLQRNHRRLDRLLRSLLDTLALGSGRELDLHATSFALEELIAEVVSDNAAMLEGRVAWEGSAQGWWDRDALFRVVENLVLNAQKYGQPSTPIWCRITSPSPTHVQLAVENSGTPIPREAWETIFEPFTRGEDKRASTPGWGVGLAFARAVARRHGGEIRVGSSDERATVFLMDLPVDARTALKA